MAIKVQVMFFALPSFSQPRYTHWDFCINQNVQTLEPALAYSKYYHKEYNKNNRICFYQ